MFEEILGVKTETVEREMKLLQIEKKNWKRRRKKTLRL